MSDTKKYDILFDENNKDIFLGKIVHRIKALNDIKNRNGIVIVKKDEIGGYVETEHNLSQEGSCWIFDDAIVCDHANLSGDSRIFDEAVMHGHSSASGFSTISGYACICGNTHIENEHVWLPVSIPNNQELEKVINLQATELEKDKPLSGIFPPQSKLLRKEEKCKECNKPNDKIENKNKSKF